MKNNKTGRNTPNRTNRTNTKPAIRRNNKKDDKKPFIKKEKLQTEEKFQTEEKEFVEDFLQLEGRNAILEALKSDKEIDKIFLKQSEQGTIEGSLKVIKAMANEKKIVVMEVNKAKLDQMSQSGNHQGAIAFCPAVEYVEISDILENAKNKNEVPFILIVDSITDPHNLGAIIRSCEACGVHGVIIPKRRAVGISGIVSKTSAGAIEYVPICKVTNLNRAIEELKENGVWIGASDMEGQSIYDAKLTGPIAIVVGSEGEGVSRLLKENCDFIVSIPMAGKIESLNASVAAGVIMYEIVRQRNLK